MDTPWERFRARMNIPIPMWATYIAIYLILGTLMNTLGTVFEIARFTHWWQVITVYAGFMVPVSVLLKGMPFFRQYAYGLVAIGILEFGGYSFETSYAFPGNILDRLFGERNFSLAMSLFFALYFPLGNRLVGWVYNRIKPSS